MKTIRSLKEKAETKSYKAFHYHKSSLNIIRTKLAETLYQFLGSKLHT